MQIRENIPLAPLTVFKIGGRARYFCEAVSCNDVRDAVAYAAARHVPFVVLGAGSNVLVADEGYSGLVIKMNMRNVTMSDTTLIVDAGASMAQVVAVTVGAGLTGFEWAIGVPGSIGGSVVGNAGCFGREMKDVVVSVEVLDTKSGVIETMSGEVCHFAYRHSLFKESPELIVLGATLFLSKTSTADVQAKVVAFSRARIEKKAQTSGTQGAQEVGAQCAGCMFKNPKPDLAAGFLIDTAGLKGLRVGNAMVSQQHANFFLNCGGATAHDVEELVREVKQKIKEKFDIDLHEEVRRIK